MSLNVLSYTTVSNPNVNVHFVSMLKLIALIRPGWALVFRLQKPIMHVCSTMVVFMAQVVNNITQ